MPKNSSTASAMVAGQMNHGEFSLANFVPLPFGAAGGGLVEGFSLINFLHVAATPRRRPGEGDASSLVAKRPRPAGQGKATRASPPPFDDATSPLRVFPETSSFQISRHWGFVRIRRRQRRFPGMLPGYQNVDGGNHQQREQRADGHAGDEYDADGVARGRAGAGNEDERNIAGHGGHAGHQHRAQPQQRRLTDGLDFGPALVLKFVGELDDENTVF